MLDGMAEVPMGVATQGGMFTLLRVLPDPALKGPWRHPRQDEVEAKQRGAK